MQAARWAAKAVVAWGVPTATALVSLASQWLTITDDGFVSGDEWKLFLVGVISGVAVFFKKNAPTPTN